MRLNDWTAILVFLGAVAYFVWSRKKFPGREESPYPAVDGAVDSAGVSGTDNAADGTVGADQPEAEKLVADSEPAADPDDTGAVGETDTDTDTPGSAPGDTGDSEVADLPNRDAVTVIVTETVPARSGQADESSNP